MITLEQYKILVEDVDRYNNEKYGYRHIDYIDIIHTYFYPNQILNDWFEGEHNDRYYNERGEYLCSEYRFINEEVAKLKNEKI